MNAKVHRAANASRSPAFRVFGLGIDPLEMAERVDRLRSREPRKCALLFDVANRVLFADYLRFEVGWNLERSARDSGQYLRVSENLDALEIYLLCTCIDALGTHGGRDGFRKAFLDLASGLKRSLSEAVVLLKGGLGDDAMQFEERFGKWQRLGADEKLDKLAAEYFWDCRRCKYTHRSHIDPALVEGLWRRNAKSGRMLGVQQGEWGASWLFSANEPDRVRYTVLTRRSLEEGFLLRAVVAMSALSRILSRRVGADYFYKYIGYYETLGDIYASLGEMERNRRVLEALSAPELLSHYWVSKPQLLPTLESTAAERLVAEHGGLSSLLAAHLASYLRSLRRVNDRVGRFNASLRGEAIDCADPVGDLRAFCSEPGFAQTLGESRWYHRWIHRTLRDWLDSGYVVPLFLSGSPHWGVVWQELRHELANQPPCPVHSSMSHVKTLSQGVINDILHIGEDGVIVRSHLTLKDRFIAATRFERWWAQLRIIGEVDLSAPPATQDSRIVAALIVAGLPHRVCVTNAGVLGLLS